MKVERLLQAATGSTNATSGRQQYMKMAHMLNANRQSAGDPVITAKAVGKWVDRQNIPGTWLGKIVVAARVAGRNIDIVDYV